MMKKVCIFLQMGLSVFSSLCFISCRVGEGNVSSAVSEKETILDDTDDSSLSSVIDEDYIISDTEGEIIYLWKDEEIPAWQGNQSGFDSAEFRPYIKIYPAQGNIKGALLICPGGGLQFKCMKTEGYDVAEKFSELGYQCFVVSYRLKPYSQEEIALDLTRAIRYVKYHADEYGIEENDIALVGFSAGGVLCGEHALNWKGSSSPKLLDDNYTPDEIDGVNADVAAIGHIYSFYGSVLRANNNVEVLRQGNLPPTFYAYGTKDFFTNSLWKTLKR